MIDPSNFSGWDFSGLAAAPVTNEPIIWTPSDRQERAKRLHNDLLVFNNDMARAKDAKKLPDGQLEAWRIFRDGWTKWYGAATATTWLWTSTNTLLADYEQKLAAWRDWYRTAVGAPTGVGPSNIVDAPLIPASIQVDVPDLQKASDTWMWWAAAGLLAAGGLYALRRVSKSGALSGDFPGAAHMSNTDIEDEKRAVRRAAKAGEISWTTAHALLRDLDDARADNNNRAWPGDW